MVLEQFEPTESKCQKWSTISRWKGEIASSFLIVISSGNTMACKWMDNRSVLLLSSALEGVNDILSVQRGEKGWKTKSSVTSPKFVKLYNSGMGGVDLMDQRTAAYRLDRKSSARFYLHIFFDLMDIACVNSYLIYNMKHPNKLSLLYYEILVAESQIQYHQGQKRAVPMSRPSKRKNQPESIDNHGGHLPDYQTMRKRCAYCAMEGKKIKHLPSVWLVTFHYA